MTCATCDISEDGADFLRRHADCERLDKCSASLSAAGFKLIERLAAKANANRRARALRDNYRRSARTLAD